MVPIATTTSFVQNGHWSSPDWISSVVLKDFLFIFQKIQNKLWYSSIYSSTTPSWWRQLWLTNNRKVPKSSWEKPCYCSLTLHTGQTHLCNGTSGVEDGGHHYNWHDLSSEVISIFSRNNRGWHWWYLCLIQSILNERTHTYSTINLSTLCMAFFIKF